jgi:hypothetical protein
MSERILCRGAELQQVAALLADEPPAARSLVLTGDVGVGRRRSGVRACGWPASAACASSSRGPLSARRRCRSPRSADRLAVSRAALGLLRMKPTAAGRKQLRHAKQLRLTAKGTFTPVPDPPVTAKRQFTLRR